MRESSVTISLASAELAVSCVAACANDPKEPQRYRDWYAEVASELRNGIAMAKNALTEAAPSDANAADQPRPLRPG